MNRNQAIKTVFQLIDGYISYVELKGDDRYRDIAMLRAEMYSLMTKSDEPEVCIGIPYVDCPIQESEYCPKN